MWCLRKHKADSSNILCMCQVNAERVKIRQTDTAIIIQQSEFSRHNKGLINMGQNKKIVPWVLG